MRAIKMIGRILNWLLTVLLAIVLACNLYAVGVRYITGTPQPAVFGWSWAVVISGSMEPEIGIDALIIVHEEDSYAVGDVITYENGNSVVTHRIIAQAPEGYITKGDANNTEDQFPVAHSAVVGKVACVVPKVGLLIGYLKTPLGMTCLVLIGFLLIEIPYLVNKRKEEEVAEDAPTHPTGNE